jgi:hypothetical protein
MAFRVPFVRGLRLLNVKILNEDRAGWPDGVRDAFLFPDAPCKL